MILKEDQRSCLKIECARGRNARQCYEGLQEACGECALPHRTVARWVIAFKGRRQNVTDMPQPGHPMGRRCADQNATIREFANDSGLATFTVLNILKKWLGMRKIASRWVPYDLTENKK